MATLYKVTMTQAEYNAYIATPTNIIPSNYEIFISDAAAGTPNLYTGIGTNTPVSGSVGGTGGAVFEDWTASTAYAAGDKVIATVTVGAIGAGARLRRNTAGTSGATFNTTEAAKWTELAIDDDVVPKTAIQSAFQTTPLDTNIASEKLVKDNLNLKAPIASPTFTGTVAGITKTMVGLGNADNTADTAKPISTAQQTALNEKAPLASPTFTGTVSGITKAMVGLGSVDNTADTAKPVSTAQQTALNLKAPLASPTFTGTVSGVTKAMVGLGSVDNTVDTAKPVSTATQTALNAKSDATHNHDALYFTEAEVNNQFLAKSSLAVTPTIIHPENFAATTATGTAGTYTVSASSEFSGTYAGWKCFDNSDTTDWATLGVTTNFWVRMVLPAARIVTSIIVRGRNSGAERITNWIFQGSNDGTIWTALLSSTTVLGNTAQTFTVSNSTAYTQYRLFANTGEATNPGLSRLTLRADGFAFNNPVV